MYMKYLFYASDLLFLIIGSIKERGNGMCNWVDFYEFIVLIYVPLRLLDTSYEKFENINKIKNMEKN